MKIDHANSWLSAIAGTIEERCIDIDLWPSVRQVKMAIAPNPGALNDPWNMNNPEVNKQHMAAHCGPIQMSRQVWRLLNPQIEEKDAHLPFNLSVPVINYLKVYLENSLFNLINNVITYTRPGEISEIMIRTGKEEQHVVQSAPDNGIGIDFQMHQEQLSRDKRMFHRGYRRIGAGLFKIMSQIRAFRAILRSKSKSGRGSRFYVYFNNRVHTLTAR